MDAHGCAFPEKAPCVSEVALVSAEVAEFPACRQQCEISHRNPFRPFVAVINSQGLALPL